RMDLVTFIFHDFLSLSDQGEGIVRVRLVTAAPSGTLETRLQKLLQEKTGLKPVIVTEVDPSLMGGFRIELEDRLLDASVRHQLDTIRTQLLARNRRIV
ncbi:MAG: F0F1 ATP synthase subunit delta, partial [Bacteroidales bacterium]|nr:F0F1 ATP synthase subunit delta [Bacteroidales bacterium]